MTAMNRDRHFNHYVEILAADMDAQLASRSAVVRAVKRLAFQQRQWQAQARFLVSQLRT